jgi:iron complex outermembrane receptor protein
MRFHVLARACVLVVAVLTTTQAGAQGPAAGVAAAQVGVSLSGRLVNSLSGEPIPGATVTLDELRRQTTSKEDGTFTFDNVPPGTYHVSVLAQGYSSRRSEIQVTAGGVVPDVRVDPELHFQEVISVAADSRSQFETFQPTSVLAGQELQKQLETSVGATLESQPGVAARSFGPAPARPVIRGLGGDRVLVLQDGQRMADLSSQSGDHGVTANPAAAQRIEVVRGPATLLYGANAVGGLVNIISEDIPTRPVLGATGNFTFDLGSAAKEGGAAGSVRAGNGRFALQAGGAGRRSSDVDTPEGELVNSQSRSGLGTVGLSWTGEKGYFGGSYGYDDTKYGAPVVEDGLVELTPRKHAFSLRGGGRELNGAFDAFRGTLGIRRYKHEELLAGDVETVFVNNTVEGEITGSHRTAGRLKGSLGGSVLAREFSTTGSEALAPPIDSRTVAVFLYEELTWPHVTLQFGGRFDRINYEPVGEPARDFTTGSGSFGLLFRPAAADDRVTVALSLARAARAPALEELFYFGPHPGNFAFEVGNPDLEPEHALGFDLSLRWRGSRASGEVTYFRNDIRDYIFTAPLSEEDFAAREEEFEARFPGREIREKEVPGEEHAHEFPFIEYEGADSVLQGIEAHGDFALTSELFFEAQADYVHGTLKDTGEPLPRIPPLRFGTGLRWQRNAFQVGGHVRFVARQDRIFSTETETDGYQLLRLFASYSIPQGDTVHTITGRVDNATNELYRNHLSLIKDLAPEMGVNVRLLYHVTF